MISLLPTINATLNALSAVLLVWGYLLIRRQQWERHRRVMKTAFATSCLFLAGYLVYHSQVGSVPFHHEGTTLRTVYFAILLTHTILAAAVPVLAVATLRRGLSARYGKHRRLARWTLPIWLYVSVTGVVVYVMLYHVA
jgi:uncharacterized membrane protein YozB (DUF420 family)